MERLTMKNSDGTYSQPTHLTFEKMFYKLAEFEDFMENLGLEDLEELEHIIGYPRFIDGYDENNNPINKVEFVTYIESFRELLEEKKLFKDAIEELLETNNHIKGVSDKYYKSYNEKFNRVLELAKENQALKDRWQQLKDDLMLYYTVGSTSGAYGYDVYKTIFNKMQELEKGEMDEKNN